MHFLRHITRFLLIFSLLVASIAKAEFNYEVYAGDYSLLPNFNQLTPQSTGTTNAISLEVTNLTDQFGLVFTNTLVVNTAGTYQFRISSDDGSRLLINGNAVIDNDGLHASNAKEGEVVLQPGNYALRVEFFEKYGDQSLDAHYRVAGGIYAPIPANGVLNGVAPSVSQIGEWGSVIQWPHIAISTANLPDGRILTWSSTEVDAFPAGADFTHASVFDPANLTFETVNNNFHDMFCAGVSTLEDGTIVAAGGNPDDQKTSAFDPSTLTWASLGDMFDRRWYGTSITLANNQVFTGFAKSSGNRSEKYDPVTNQWIRTPNASMQTLLDEHNAANGLEWFPLLAVQPNGRVFHGWPTQTFHSFDPVSGQANEAFGRPTGDRARKWSNIVTYDVGKVLILGGADLDENQRTLTTNVYQVDLNGPTPIISQAAPMLYPRALSNAVTLPNGEILVIGGNTNGENFQDAGSVLATEIYSPITNEWRVADEISVPRNYHSTAVLMKDGRVFSAGGGACGTGCVANHADAQIFTPPYLFNSNGSLATRPTLASVPDITGAGTSFIVEASADTQRFSMVRLSATTHHVNTDQRFVPVESVSNEDGTFSLTMQANPNVLIAGNYWLFAVNANGTPSIGQTIQVRRDFVQDTDGDGVPDEEDAFPTDPNETVDTDQDGVGNNADSTPNGEGDLPTGAIQCAVENGTCQIPDQTTAIVWYGANDQWYSRQNITTNIACDNATFGDPLVGTFKACFYTKQVEFTPVTPLPIAPRGSTTLIVENSTGVDHIWNVNPDNNTVSVINSEGVLLQEIVVGQKPWSLAKVPNINRVMVTNKASGSISVINTQTFALEQTIGIDSASQPHGIVFDQSGASYFVVLEALAQVQKRDANNHQLLASLQLTGRPRHISITHDDSRLLVSNFITPPVPGENTANVNMANGAGEVFVINPVSLSLQYTVGLTHDNRQPSESQGPGLPNYLNAPVVSFDNQVAYVPSKKDNILSGALRGNIGMTFDHTVRSNTSIINLSNVSEGGLKIDFDNASVATGAALTGENRYLLVALETSRELAVYDTENGFEVMRLPTGRAPQGVAVSSDGSIAYVHNFMDRSLSRFDLTEMINTSLPASHVLATVGVVFNEQLPTNVLKGKQFFYDAADDRLARDNYMSCASCHNDGGEDGRVWDFTGFGEGLRNTIALNGRAGMQHGLLHWSGNFDEVQDFEGQIRRLSGGTGLMPNAEFNQGTRSETLGDPKLGISEDLDALAAYVSSLDDFAPSPYRFNGQLTNQAQSGRALFISQNCASCHGGVNFTRSGSIDQLADIGTIKATSGMRLEEAIIALDVPTLRDVWATAPYLHDGSAPTIGDAIVAHENLNLTNDEINQLAAFVSQIGNGEADGIQPVVNSVPSIELMAPESSSGNVSGSIEAVASDLDGVITKVEFYYNNQFLEAFTAAPYIMSWQSVPNGTYVLTAKAYDDSVAVATSNAVTIVVDNTGNVAPVVTLNAPDGGPNFATGSIEAIADDPDGIITKVEFYYNGTYLQTITRAPYVMSWDNVPSGSYALTAKAFDNAGGVSESNVVTVNVNNN